jgi:hypothetical protein
VLALTASIASADGPNWTTVSQDFQGQIFGLNVARDDDELLAADGGAGPTELDIDSGDTSLIASLPGVTDVIQVGRREYLALTGGGGPGGDTPESATLWRIKNGQVTRVTLTDTDGETFDSILEWELKWDPDQSGNDPNEDAISNPFDLTKLSGNKVIVADAGGNSVLAIDKKGNIELVAVLPYEDVSTQPLKDLVGCPAGPPDLCNLPPTLTADPVATTTDIGPDGAIYAGELKGFPATPGTSRVWRIDRNARGVQCDVDNDGDDGCALVDTPPFTSILDIKFEDGTAYVVEADEASWLAAGEPQALGGTVNACSAGSNGGGDGDDDDDDDDRRGNGNHNGNGNRNGNGSGNGNGNGNGGGNGTVTWTCTEVATGLPFPTAVAIADDGIFVALAHGFEGPFEVARLTAGNGDGDGEEDDD